MNIRPRLIPLLTLDNYGLVKTRKFKKWKYLGDPENIIRIFNDKRADELILFNIGKDQINLPFLKKICSNCFMPITFGGQINTVKQAEHVFHAGIEKICLRSLAVNDKSTLRQMVNEFGSASISVKIDISTNIFGNFLHVKNKKLRVTSADITKFVSSVTDLGVGEIILNSITRDGMSSGFEFDFFSSVVANCAVPCLISGGCGSDTDIKNAFIEGYDGVCVGSYFVLSSKQHGVLIQYPNEKLFDDICLVRRERR